MPFIRWMVYPTHPFCGQGRKQLILCNTHLGMNELPVYSPIYPPENPSLTTYMPNELKNPSEAPSAKGIARLTVHIPSMFRQKMPCNVGVPHSRWSTAEFKIYYAVAFFIIPVMIWIPMSLSLRKISFLC